MRKKYDVFDVTKYILSFMIVGMHSELFPLVLEPWVQLAVPLFFIISGYLLFAKMYTASESEKKLLIRKYIRRNLYYYIFWFIGLLPLILLIRKDWYHPDIFRFLWNVVTNLLFSSSFSASWFISASIWGAYFLYISRRVRKWITIPFLLSVYGLCCLLSAYPDFACQYPLLVKAVSFYQFFFTNPVFSFPIAMCWMYVGKLFAEELLTVKKRGLWLTVAVFSAWCLKTEWLLVYARSGRYACACYFLLAPLAVCLFGCLKDLSLHVTHAATLRAISIISYPLHVPVITLLRLLSERLFRVTHPPVIFILTLVICHFVSLLFLMLEKRKRLQFLRYAH